jgi:hypothetical protein
MTEYTFVLLSLACLSCLPLPPVSLASLRLFSSFLPSPCRYQEKVSDLVVQLQQVEQSSNQQRAELQQENANLSRRYHNKKLPHSIR